MATRRTHEDGQADLYFMLYTVYFTLHVARTHEDGQADPMRR